MLPYVCSFKYITDDVEKVVRTKKCVCVTDDKYYCCFVLGLQNINICWWTAYQAKAIVFCVGV